jgi:hypothetical protein
MTSPAWPLILRFFAYIVICLVERLCGSYNILAASSEALRIVNSILIVVLRLDNNTFGSLGSMS